jgi:nitric oxide reductase subunit B
VVLARSSGLGISRTGRLWQILLFGGLIFWLLIVYRAVGRQLNEHKDDFRALIWFYVFSAVLVVAFFMEKAPT